MEHVVRSPSWVASERTEPAPGDLVSVGDALALIETSGDPEVEAVGPEVVDLDAVRPDLAELHHRRSLVLDAGRPEAVDRRHASGRRTARENIDDLCDPGSFTEYGSYAIAAQRARRPLEELIERTPADGLVAGLARVNGSRFVDERSSCAVLSYDYTVLAGTQGQHGVVV